MSKDKTKLFKDETKLFGDRRNTGRVPVRFDVNCRYDETYLFTRASNLSELGIFLVTSEPAALGSEVDLQFKAPDGSNSGLEVRARVVWIDRNSQGVDTGMGLEFIEIEPELQKRIRTLIRTVAYLD